MGFCWLSCDEKFWLFTARVYTFKGRIVILGRIVSASGQIFRSDFHPQDEILRPGMQFCPLDEQALSVGMASKRRHFSSWKDSWWKWHFFVRLMASFKLQLSSSPKMQAEICFKYTQSLSRGKKSKLKSHLHEYLQFHSWSSIFENDKCFKVDFWVFHNWLGIICLLSST